MRFRRPDGCARSRTPSPSGSRTALCESSATAPRGLRHGFPGRPAVPETGQPCSGSASIHPDIHGSRQIGDRAGRSDRVRAHRAADEPLRTASGPALGRNAGGPRSAPDRHEGSFQPVVAGRDVRILLVRAAARRAVAGRRGMIRTHPRCTIRAHAGTVDPRADETVSPRAHVYDVLPRFMLCEGVDPWGAAVRRPSRRRSPGS